MANNPSTKSSTAASLASNPYVIGCAVIATLVMAIAAGALLTSDSDQQSAAPVTVIMPDADADADADAGPDEPAVDEEADTDEPATAEDASDEVPADEETREEPGDVTDEGEGATDEPEGVEDAANESIDDVEPDQPLEDATISILLPGDTPAEDAAPATDDAEPAPEPVEAPADEAADEPAAEAEPEELAFVLPDIGPPARVGIYRDGKIYLEGAAVDQAQVDQIVEIAAQVLGPDNVVNNLTVDADAAESSDGRVIVDEPILFAIGSAEIAPDFFPILNLGVAVMALQPQVTMRVEGHTDDIGSPEANQALSLARAQAVVDYLIERGVDPVRLEAVGLGEDEPIADNSTEEGRQFNRRIEVDLLGLLS